MRLGLHFEKTLQCLLWSAWGQVASRTLGHDVSTGRGREALGQTPYPWQKTASERAQPRRRGEDLELIAPAGSGKRKPERERFLKRGGLRGNWQKKSRSFSQERKEQSHGELKSDILRLVDLRHVKVIKISIRWLCQRGENEVVPAALGTFLEPVAQTRSWTHFHQWKREESNRLSSCGLAPPQFPWHQSGLLAQDQQP